MLCAADDNIIAKITYEYRTVQLQKQIAKLNSYGCIVVKRVISTIKFIVERGLVFRENNEIIGLPRNGNFFGIFELVVDPFLLIHIK